MYLLYITLLPIYNHSLIKQQAVLTLYKCEVLFLSRFHPNNVLGIRSFADTLGSYSLITEADRYIHQYFHDVSVADEYLNLTCPALLNILQSDELHVFSEEQVGVSGQ